MLLDEGYKDRVLAATDIVAVISQHVELKRAGREWSGCCPFHGEKSASFYVNPAKQVYKCHGCGASGSVVRFVMEQRSLTFQEAIEVLAGEASMLPLQYAGESSPAPAGRTLAYAALEHAAAYFQSQLASSEEARSYCTHRDISEATIKRFRIGWAPSSWDRMGKALAKFETSVMLEAGLQVIGKDKRPHDRFRGRLMFPILDRRGRVIAFGGRVIGSVSGPKYLNSPETPLFHKSDELFGLWHVLHPDAEKGAGDGGEHVVVVEGFTDVIALHQCGMSRAVAALGTSLTSSHLATLFAITPELVFCFDADAAGAAAAWRALDTVLPELTEGRSARFMFLPAGADPDSLVREQGAEGFLSKMHEALPLSEYLFDHLARECGSGSIEAHARLAEKALALVAKIPAGAYQRALVAEVERRTGLSPQHGASPASAPAPPASETSLAYVLSGMLLDRPHLARLLPRDWSLEKNDEPGVAFLRRLIRFLQAHPGMTHQALLQHVFAAPARADLERASNAAAPDADPTQIAEEFERLMANLARQIRGNPEHTPSTPRGKPALSIVKSAPVPNGIGEAPSSPLDDWLNG